MRFFIHDKQECFYQAACDIYNFALQTYRGNHMSLTLDLLLHGFIDEPPPSARFFKEQYSILFDLVNQRVCVPATCSVEHIREFNLITDKINHQLKLLGSKEKPCRHQSVIQPLVNIVGLFVTQNRQQFNQYESYLTQDLTEKLDDGSFFVPAECEEALQHESEDSEVSSKKIKTSFRY